MWLRKLKKYGLRTIFCTCFDTIIGIYANKDAAEKVAEKMRVEEKYDVSYGVTVYKLQ